MPLPTMPPKVRAFAERPVWNLVYTLAGVAAVFGFAAGVSGRSAIAILLVLMIVAFLLREWLYYEDRQTASEVQRLRQVLERVTAPTHADFEEDVEETWYVDENRKDRTVLAYRTSVADGQTLVFRRLKFSSTEAPAPRDGEDRVSARLGGSELATVRILERTHELAYLVFFEPALRGEPGLIHEWTMERTWPGLWDQLRDGKEDEVSLVLRHPSARATLKIVFPAGYANAPQRFIGRVPSVGTENFEHPPGGCPTLVWEIPEPQTGIRYVAYLKLSGK